MADHGIEQIVVPPQRATFLDRAGLVDRPWFQFLTALYRRGMWTPIAFDASAFTGNGAMTWIVAEADQVTLAYTLVGKTLTFAFTLRNTTVGGVLNNELRIEMPRQFTAAREMHVPVTLTDNGTRTTGCAIVVPDSTTIGIRRTNDANFAAATNATDVEGQLTFEVKGA